jgi:hypothetical protein
VGKRQSSVDNQLLGLPGLYLWHAIGTFNTCSRVPTSQSLTDTGGGYNLGGARFPPKGPARSQIIQSQHKPLVKWCETPLADPWSFDHLVSFEAYVYA